ncbi:hypothetical protein FRB90_002722, partial [Tulasnella sp. 427]
MSFTIRRPSPMSSRQPSAGPESNATTPAPSFRIPPPPRQQNIHSNVPSRLKHEHSEREEIDSSDEEDPEAAELVSGFDSMGVQRVKASAKSNGPLVIPVLKNRDWRQLARQRQAANGYIPDGARASAMTGPDGSQGGLGTRDSINSGPQLAGLIQKARSTTATQSEPQEPSHSEPQSNADTEMTPAQPLTEDEIALQALLSGTDNTTAVPQVPAIPLAPMTEEAALQRDLTELPETATLDDYARVPVEQFGMAMLRGMGWKPPASGEDELWIPAERPALLGLGAKARPTPQGGGNSRSQALNWKTSDRKYVPLVKKDRNGEIVEDAKDTRGTQFTVSLLRSAGEMGVKRFLEEPPPFEPYQYQLRYVESFLNHHDVGSLTAMVQSKTKADSEAESVIMELRQCHDDLKSKLEAEAAEVDPRCDLYEEQMLDRGGYSDIYLGHWRPVGNGELQPVAVKHLRPKGIDLDHIEEAELHERMRK